MPAKGIAYQPNTVERVARERHLEAKARAKALSDAAEFNKRTTRARKLSLLSLGAFLLGLLLAICGLYVPQLWAVKALMALAFNAWLAGGVLGVIAVRAIRDLRFAKIATWLNLAFLLLMAYIIFIISMRGNLGH